MFFISLSNFLQFVSLFFGESFIFGKLMAKLDEMPLVLNFEVIDDLFHTSCSLTILFNWFFRRFIRFLSLLSFISLGFFRFIVFFRIISLFFLFFFTFLLLLGCLRGSFIFRLLLDSHVLDHKLIDFFSCGCVESDVNICFLEFGKVCGVGSEDHDELRLFGEVEG